METFYLLVLSVVCKPFIKLGDVLSSWDITKAHLNRSGKAIIMKHRFVLHNLNHSILMVDISDFVISEPQTGEIKVVPAFRIAGWNNAAQYLRAKEADEKTIETTKAGLDKWGVVVATIV